MSGFVVVLAAKVSHFRFKFKEINDFISKIISYWESITWRVH